MLDGRQHRRWCSATGRHCLFFTLALAVLLFYYRLNIKDSAGDWRPEWWMKYDAAKWWTTLKSLNIGNNPLMGVDFISPHATVLGTQAEDIKSAPINVSSHINQQVLENQMVTLRQSPYVVAYPSEYHFILNEPNKCEEQKPFVALIVPVAPDNRRDRDLIRSTWGGESLVLEKVVNVFFLLGLHTGDLVEELEEQLQQESKVHKDLIQSNFLDCYNNLTIKTMVMLEWLSSYCSIAPYAMKIDSDIYLNVPNLINMLLNVEQTNYMTGLVVREAAVLRDPTSKWYVPTDVYPKPLYPRYALGLGYVLSMDLPKKLVHASRYVQAIYIEDVYLGLCMEYLGIPLTDPPDWNFFHVIPVPYNRCDYSKLIATTLDEHTNLTWIWKALQQEGKFC